ncbi:endolytic transglycosylase MltG [Tepidibacter formicigenes]|jgi:cell division protein YceG involved in septum cleavage|uniref:YceG-like family protein n=1 Tax=Tepidibacter formicigenes DSM 15518 TaxID=1123349 RepID=A0A1M6N5D1_9FIRM|nr:endolytic transglycosylase MltG [Tepidibacter formicigenes]SHJ90897.1 YceG-like family protein [Tepidibacter formicigenes DSM 15518]
MEKLKDILYEISDLILGFVVLLVIISTIGWQLYGWFDSSEAKSAFKIDNEIKVEDKIPNNSIKKNTTENPKITIQEIVSFEIKSGQTGIKIAENLKNLELIDSVDDFLNTLKKSNLENSMKAGTYKITKGSSLEEIIHILTK